MINISTMKIHLPKIKYLRHWPFCEIICEIGTSNGREKCHK